MPSNICKFLRKHGGSTKDDLITVFYAKDMQILWNRQGIFYIRTEEYNVNKRIQYAQVLDLEHAQRLGKILYHEYAVETNRRAK